MTHLPTPGSDKNVGGLCMTDSQYPMNHICNILIELDSNNPPKVLAGTRFSVYKTGTYLIPSTPPTGNNAYPANETQTYLNSDIIFEQADVNFAWNSGNFPVKTNSTTYYLYCSGGEDVDETSRGKGVYGATTSVPTWSELKGGFYQGGNRCIAIFYVDGSGNVSIKGVLAINGMATIEIPTNITWIDGRRVYRKVIDFGALPNSSSTGVAHGITFGASTRILSVNGYGWDGTNRVNIPEVSNSAVSNQIGFYFDTTNIYVITGADYSAFTECFITLEYVY